MNAKIESHSAAHHPDALPRKADLGVKEMGPAWKPA